MALTPSTMLELGTQAFDFSLPEVVSGRTVTLGTFSGKKALVVIFLSRYCPYVQHVKAELAALGNDYLSKSVGIVGISANDVSNHPDDSPDNLRSFALELRLAPRLDKTGIH